MPGWLSVARQGAVMHPAYGACPQLVCPIPLVGTQSKLKVEKSWAPGIRLPWFTELHTGAELIAPHWLPSTPH